MPEKSYIVIYQDEVTFDAWKDYCNVTGCPRDAEYVKIYFDEKEVEWKEND